MYNTLNIALMFTGLSVPFVCLCRNVRQKLWPVMVSLACGCGFLILQIVILVLRADWAGEYGLSHLTDGILRISLLFLIGLLVTVGCYICSSFFREGEEGKLAVGWAGQLGMMLLLQLVLQLLLVLYSIFRADVFQYTGFNLVEQALPWMWVVTLLVIGLLAALNRTGLSWITILPVAVVWFILELVYPVLYAGRMMEQMAYEMDDYFRVLLLLYALPVSLILLLAVLIKRGKGRYLLGLLLAGLICAIVLMAPEVHYVNSQKTVYAYTLGEENPRGDYRLSIHGVFVKQILGADLFDGWWSLEGYTDGAECITTFSPDDRPYKNVTRYDESGEQITGASFQFFGNSRFTDYVIIIDRMMEDSNPNSDWDPEKGTVLCTDAPDYHALVETAARNHISYFGNYYKEAAEVTP